MLARATAAALLALALTPAAALTLTPAAASAAPRHKAVTRQDRASTHAYIQANFALERAADASIAPTEAAAALLNQKLGQECPQVAAGSPQDAESQKASYEIAGALWSISYGAVAGPISTFAQAVEPLHWSNPKITRIARHYAQSLTELAALPMPDICADVRTWSASGFHALPAPLLSFVQHAESIEGHTIPPRLLAPYERPSDRAIVASTSRLETKLERAESVAGFADWDTLLETLALSQ
jgi:hypothetical protein